MAPGHLLTGQIKLNMEPSNASQKRKISDASYWLGFRQEVKNLALATDITIGNTGWHRKEELQITKGEKGLGDKCVFDSCLKLNYSLIT